MVAAVVFDAALDARRPSPAHPSAVADTVTTTNTNSMASTPGRKKSVPKMGVNASTSMAKKPSVLASFARSRLSGRIKVTESCTRVSCWRSDAIADAAIGGSSSMQPSRNTWPVPKKTMRLAFLPPGLSACWLINRPSSGQECST